MKKTLSILSVTIIIIISIFGYLWLYPNLTINQTIDSKQSKRVGNKQNVGNSENSEQQITEDYNELDFYSTNKTKYLDLLLNNINSKEMPIKRISIGYDSSDNLLAIIVPSEENESEIDLRQLPEPKYGFYLAFISKIILDSFPEINKIWVFREDDVSSHILSITRNTDKEKDLQNLIFEQFNLSSSNKKIADFVDLYGYAIVKDSLNFNPISTYFKEIYGDRFNDFKYIPVTFSIEYFEANINEKLESINYNELKSDISKALVASIGRYNNHEWKHIEGTRITYEENNKKLFKISMNRNNYIEWKKNGLNPNDVFSYCKVEIYDPFIQSQFENVEKIKYAYQHNSTKNFSYEKTMEELEKLQGVEVELLTSDSVKDRIVMLKIKDTTDLQEVYKKEMDLTHKIMRLPVNTIWFLTEDGNKYRFLKMDRDRYNLLLYMNNQDKFDFQPDEWPIMAGSYWEIDKSNK